MLHANLPYDRRTQRGIIQGRLHPMLASNNLDNSSRVREIFELAPRPAP